MRIKNLQQNLRERGRIRLGYSTLNARGKKVPHKLNRFRFTTPDRETIDALAALYGGTPEPWREGGRDKWQVTSEVDTMNVIYPSHMGLWQCYEQYKGGYVAVRCDGERYMTPQAKGRLADEGPCACDPDNRTCAMTTAVSLIAVDLPGLGTLRLVTHGFFAAVELAASVDLIESAMAAGMRVPCRLFLTERESRKLVDGKPELHQFVTPVLDLAMSVAALGSGGGGGTGVPLEGGPSGLVLGPGTPVALPTGWRPVDQQALAPAPLVTVADQLADAERTPKPRSNAAPPVPSTGRKPRTAAEAAAATPNCSVCDLPYGTAKVVPNPEPGGSRFVHETCLDKLDVPEEGDPPADQPPPEGEPARGGGGAAGRDEASAPADPSPAASPTGYVRMMTPAQHRKAMALTAEAWPGNDLTGREADDMHRERLLYLCAVLGQPRLTSRTQITASTAPLVLDALTEIRDGTLALTDSGLVDAESGEVKVAAP